MKPTWSPLAVLITAVMLTACGHHGAEDHSHDAEEHTRGAEGHAAQAGASTPGDGLERVRLNDQERWQMDEHTRSVFAKMAASFVGTDHAALEGDGLKAAGAELQGDVDVLIAGCTMTGEAHDQLHAYLLGYMPAVAALAESGRVEDAQRVEHYLERYGDFFE